MLDPRQKNWWGRQGSFVFLFCVFLQGNLVHFDKIIMGGSNTRSSCPTLIFEELTTSKVCFFIISHRSQNHAPVWRSEWTTERQREHSRCTSVRDFTVWVYTQFRSRWWGDRLSEDLSRKHAKLTQVLVSVWLSLTRNHRRKAKNMWNKCEMWRVGHGKNRIAFF